MNRLVVSYQGTNMRCTRKHKQRYTRSSCSETVTRSSADTCLENALYQRRNEAPLPTALTPCKLLCVLIGCKKKKGNNRKEVVSSFIGQRRKKLQLPSVIPAPTGCWDCSKDCRISINLEMQLDTGASARDGETLSRSIN